MKIIRTFIAATIPILAMTAELAPAASGASEGAGCGSGGAIDPGLRAAFAEFDRNQSLAAAKICAIYLNSVPALR